MDIVLNGIGGVPYGVGNAFILSSIATGGGGGGGGTANETE